MKKAKYLPPSGVGKGPLAPWLCWNIWLSRNNKVFSDKEVTVLEVVSKTIREAREWQNGQVNKTKVPTINQNVQGLCGETSMSYKCQTNAAWLEESKMGGFGWTLWNQRQDSTLHFSQVSNFVKSPLLAEGMAIRAAVSHATTKAKDNIGRIRFLNHISRYR